MHVSCALMARTSHPGISQRTLADGSVRYLARVRGADRKQVSQQFTTVRDAKAFIARVRNESHQGEYVNKARGEITLAEFAKHWQSTRVDIKVSTAVRDETMIRIHILSRFGPRSLNSLVREDGQKLIAEMSKTHSPSTIRKVVTLFTAMLDEAVNARRIKAHGLAKLKMPPIAKRERRALTPNEVDQLATAIGAKYSSLIYFLSYSGLRIGEATALRHRHLDRKASTVKVVATLGEIQGKLVETTPKTKAGRRTVTIPATVMAMLPTGLPDDYVFTGREGGALRYTGFRTREFNRAVTSAGLGRLTIHDLRGTYISALYASGASPAVVMAQVGHSDSRMALDAYASATERSQQTAIDGLEKLITEQR